MWNIREKEEFRITLIFSTRAFGNLELPFSEVEKTERYRFRRSICNSALNIMFEMTVIHPNNNVE